MQSPFYKQNKIVKVDISLKQLLDVDTTNELYYRRTDNIFPNQVLTSYTNVSRRDAFRFKYLTDLIVAGSGVTITNLDGIITISSTGGGGGGVTSIDVDGGTGISVSPAGPITTSGVFTVTNTAPDQTVVLNNGTGISVTGTYPNFTINATGSGGGGLQYGVASGTNTYTVTISGVTSYVDGDTYVVKFTNGNDADSTININGLGVKTLVKEFNVQLTGGDIVSGQDLIIIYDGTNFQTLGVAPNQLFAYVTNDDSVTINKGEPVYAFGAAGNRMSVKLAYNTTDATSAQTVGLVFSSSIAPNQRGFIITQGVISGLNTAAYSAGAQLYLGPTAGSLTSTKPYAPNHLVYIGIVERANAGNGQIYVKPQNGYEMNELHDVQSNSAVNKDILYRDTTVSPNLWKPASISTILGYTPANIASPAFTGTPTAPTPASGDNDTSIATTAFVTSAVQQALSFIGYFGAGLDGNVTISGAVTLTSDMFYNDLTIAAGGSLYLAGYRIFVRGNLDLTGAGALGIHNNGYNGTNNVASTSGVQNAGGTAGRGGYGATVFGWYVGGSAVGKHKGGFGAGGGTAGGNGSSAAAVTVLTATEGLIGGNGGASGAGGNSASGALGGSGTTGQGTGIGVAGFTTYSPQIFLPPGPNGTYFQRQRQDTSAILTTLTYTSYNYVGGGHGPGGGGGGSNSTGSVAGMGGGAGGGGGGTTVVYARTIIVGPSTNAQAIAANGGIGGTGGTHSTFNGSGGGGAGGGGGGYVYLVAGSITGTTGIPFVSANGGAGGNGGDGRGAGNFGGTGGTGGYGGKITVVNLSTNAITVTDSTATVASSPSTPTGTAGSAGTAGATCTYSS